MRFLLWAMSFLLFSCESVQKRPIGLVPDSTMVLLLADMHILETAQNTKSLEADSVPFSYQELYAEIFKRHQVRRPQYDSTMMFLSVNAPEMERIYDLVIQELSEREAKTKE